MQDNKPGDESRQGGVGRTNFIKETSEQDQDPVNRIGSRDISDIDCQEGTMHHGVKGGNFDDKDEPTDADWKRSR